MKAEALQGVRSRKRRLGVGAALGALALLQTAAIFHLAGKVSGLEREARRLARDAATLAAELGQGPRPDAAAGDVAYSGGVAAADLRAIIRDELAAVGAGGGAPAAAAHAEAVATPGEDARRAAEAVRREIDSYIVRGRITEGDLAAIQQKIGLLPPGEQRKALSRLFGAINSGKIDAQL